MRSFLLLIFVTITVSVSLFAQSHTVNLKMMIQCSGVGVATLEDNIELSENESYEIKSAELGTDYQGAQTLFNAFTGTTFYFEEGSLPFDVEEFLFVFGPVDCGSGLFSNADTVKKFVFSGVFSAKAGGTWLPVFSLNEGKHAVLTIPLSDAFKDLLTTAGLDYTNLAFSYLTDENIIDPIGIESEVVGNNVVVKISHFSHIVGLNSSLITDVVKNSPQVISEYKLNQNYPNPFNPSTSIQYSVPERSVVTLKVYNILGSEVASLVNGVKEAGSYNVNFNATELSSGMYIYELKANNFIQSRKMLLIK